MTNDINTLNGALTELGETIANNLQTMGILDADASDGLTTLAGRILDIQRGGEFTGDFPLTGDKTVLSAYDNETLTLTATFTQGATVELYDNTDALVDEMTDNNDGTYTYTYTATGAGDIGFYAKAGTQVSETYSIEDSLLAKVTETTVTNNSGTKISSIGLDTIPNIQNTDFKLEFDQTGNGVLNIGSKNDWSGSTANYRLTIGYADSKNYWSVRTTSTNEGYGSSASTSTEYHYKIERENTSVRFYVDDTLIQTRTVSFLSNYSTWSIYSIIWGNGTQKIKNIKLKPL